MQRLRARLASKVEVVSPTASVGGVTSSSSSSSSSGSSNSITQTRELAPIAPALLYRRLLKLYVRKFDTDHNTIVKAWRQTKYEFWLHRDADTAAAALHNVRGQQIYEALRAGLVPIYRNDATGQTYYRYDRDTLAAVHDHMDPVSPEEFVRRFHPHMDPSDVVAIRDTLKKLGRWRGPDELRDEDVYRVKTTRKTRCTDPDE